MYAPGFMVFWKRSIDVNAEKHIREEYHVLDPAKEHCVDPGKRRRREDGIESEVGR